jgi:hypothetical protein
MYASEPVESLADLDSCRAIFSDVVADERSDDEDSGDEDEAETKAKKQ